jgi:hypothetical protein
VRAGATCGFEEIQINSPTGCRKQAHNFHE